VWNAIRSIPTALWRAVEPNGDTEKELTPKIEKTKPKYGRKISFPMSFRFAATGDLNTENDCSSLFSLAVPSPCRDLKSSRVTTVLSPFPLFKRI
jgi:hypothetical protein